MPASNNYTGPYYGYYGYNPWMYSPVPNYTYGTPTQAVPQNYSQQQMQQAPQAKQPINWVKSEKEVEDSYIEPNSAGVFWHESEPVIYLKKVDGTGKSLITTFDLVERKNAASDLSYSESPSKNEFSHLVAIVNELSNSVNGIAKELDTVKGDMYGVAGRKKSVKRGEAEDDG